MANSSAMYLAPAYTRGTKSATAHNTLYTINNQPGDTMEYKGKRRRAILDKVKAQLREASEAQLLDGMDFNNWGEAFDMLNTQFWNGALPKIPVTAEATRKAQYGWYGYKGYIKLSSNKGLSPLQMLGVLLHEMCHHYVEVTYKHGYSAAAGGKRVIGHGKEWKAEMRRVGYTGKITRYTGKERFEGVSR